MTNFRTKTQHVYDQVKQDILSGKLQPGTRLPLVSLAERFGLSTIPVREALRMLSRDKLVNIENHRGASVAQLYFRSVAELVEARLWQEVQAAMLALPHHDAKTITRLKEIHAEMERFAAEGKGTRFSEKNREFHTALYEPGHVAAVKHLVQDLWDQMWNDRSGSVIEVDKKRMIEACEEHAEIIEALENRSLRKLEKAMRRHMANTLECWDRVTGVKAARWER